jgi:hypothetical protein
MTDGVVTPMFNRPPREQGPVLFEKAADSGNRLFEQNRTELESYLASTALRGEQLPHMDFVPDANPSRDHFDGTVHALRGDPKFPVVIISDNLIRFFQRNGAERDSTRNATRYATALGFATSALSSRGVGLRSGGFDERIWNHIGIREPRQAAAYRFAAGVMNELGCGIRRDELKVGGTSLAIHAASFADPLKKAAIRDLAAPYFKSH